MGQPLTAIRARRVWYFIGVAKPSSLSSEPFIVLHLYKRKLKANQAVLGREISLKGSKKPLKSPRKEVGVVELHQ
jgi:hypothetical protein